MPQYRNRTVLEISRGIKAFLNLRVGLTRGPVPDPETLEIRLREQTRKLEQAQNRLKDREQRIGRLRREPGGVNPENMVWILGSPRTGSTWLGRILGEQRGHALWTEPFFGVVLGFRDNLANRGYVDSGQFLLGEPHREVWVGSMRRLFLDVARAKFPEMRPEDHLIIKEPNGSLSAALILEAFPESKLVFLVRDSRDVVSSLLDAAGEGSWYGYDRYEASVAEALGNGDLDSLNGRPEDRLVEQLARNYITNVSAVKDAYDRHPEGAKVMVRYEDLRADPLRQVARICGSLSIEAGREQLRLAVEKHSWENIPQGEKGKGKFNRKASPGGWREDLTPAQAESVRRITGPLLDEFYPDGE